LLRSFCLDNKIDYEECGKVVVATDEAERGRLTEILARALANGVPGVERISRSELGSIEPHVEGVEAIWSPTTAICDFSAVCRALAARVDSYGGEVLLSTAVVDITQDEHSVGVLVNGTEGSAWVRCRQVVLCGGLHSDRLAELAGGRREPRIIPFRGEYFSLVPSQRNLVRGLVYPVPDPRYPFLGIHLTKHIDGQVLVGPNAVLALAREGYRWRDVQPRDLYDTLTYSGFHKLVRQHWRTGVVEVHRSISRRAFVAEARRYLPELTPKSVVRAPSGVRAQAVDRAGQLVDDFVLERIGRILAVRNAPSPAATSSLAIASHVTATMMEP